MSKSKRTGSQIIIKRMQAASEGGHHGGAWKVAYADFVTAMMAFFLLMWLLNATTEKQRQGLADYFNPTVIQSLSGGNSGFSDGGDVPATDVQNKAEKSSGIVDSDNKDAQFNQMVQHIQNALTGTGAESMQRKNLLRHVVTRVTDEGLVIELGDLSDTPLFVENTAQPQRTTRDLTRIVATVLKGVRNQIAISGHVRAYAEVLAQSPVWMLSDARAHTIRHLLEDGGLAPSRVQRVTGHADRQNLSGDPMNPKNNRIEVILLR